MFVGRVGQLWRHPVKSMRGDRVTRAAVTEDFGFPGDRGWALRDEKAGEIRGAKRLTSLVRCHARYLVEPEGASAPPVEITFPGGETMTSDDERIDKTLSEFLDRPVSLWPRQPADDHEHYRRVPFSGEHELREQIGLNPEDPLPDYSTLPAEVIEHLSQYATPRGTYFDTMPLSLLTTTSMTSLAELAPDSTVDSRRFRQNIIVDGGEEPSGFPEFDWVGRYLRIGEVRAEVVMPISRCVMVVLAQDDLPHDRPVLRSLVQHTGMNLGIYLRVREPGHINEGDPVELY